MRKLVISNFAIVFCKTISEVCVFFSMLVFIIYNSNNWSRILQSPDSNPNNRRAIGTDFQIKSFKSFKSSNLQIYKSSNFQIFKFSNLQIFKSSNFQIFKFSNLQILQIFKFSNLQILQIFKFFK